MCLEITKESYIKFFYKMYHFYFIFYLDNILTIIQFIYFLHLFKILLSVSYTLLL